MSGRGAVLLVLLAAGACRADFSPRDWQWRFPVSGLPETPGTLVELAVEPTLFGSARADLADLRLVSAGREVPFVLSIARERREETVHRPRMLNLSSAGGETRFDLDLGPARCEHNRLTVETSSTNFTRWVSVSGSPDGRSWRAFPGRGFVFDHTVRDAGVKSSRLEVAYPLTDYRYLRASIRDDGLPPLAITGARLAKTVVLPAREVRCPAAVVSTAESPDGKATVRVLDLAAAMPHSRVSISTPAAAFHRRMEIETGASPGGEWRPAGAGDVYDYRARRDRARQTDVAYPEAVSRYLRVTLRHDDDRPLPLDDIAVFAVRRTVLFEAPGAPVLLYCGNEGARAPSYDLARTLDADTAGGAAAALGAREPSTAYAPRPLARWERHRGRILLGAVLLATLLLGWLTIRTIAGMLRPPAAPSP